MLRLDLAPIHPFFRHCLDRKIRLEPFDYLKVLDYPTDYIREGDPYSITLSSRTFLESVSNGIGFPALPDILIAETPWDGDTTAGFPVGGTIEQMEAYGFPILLGGRFSGAMPNEFGAIAYFQIRYRLLSSYSNSDNYFGGKSDLPPLYFYMPSVAYGDGIGRIRTTLTGDVVIIVD